MNIAPPSAEEAQRLLAEHVYRHPEKASITVPGDRGAPVRLPLIIGNPTGACRLPPHLRPSPAWNDSIAVTLKLRRMDDTSADLLGSDCVIYPPPPVWAEWLERWPGLTGRAADLARQKMGGILEMVREPAFDADPPTAIAEALATRPRAVWRTVALPDRALYLVIDSPGAATYDAFLDAVRKPDADLWRLCGELERACVPIVIAKEPPPAPGAARYFATISLDDMLDRWPGLGVVLIAVIAQLAGAGAEARLGEW